MTIDDLNKLTNEELNRLVAERVMGAEYRLVAAEHWHPSTDHNDAALVRKEIERRKLDSQFSIRLARILMGNDGIEWHKIMRAEDLFMFANATPRETCIAALLSVEVYK